MNTQNDFLDNAVDDELVINSAGDLDAEMCSYMQNDTEKMCSSLRNDTCGERMSITSEGFVKLLDLCEEGEEFDDCLRVGKCVELSVKESRGKPINGALKQTIIR